MGRALLVATALLLAPLAARAQSASNEFDLPRGLSFKSAVVVDRAALARQLARLEELASEVPGAQPQEQRRRILLFKEQLAAIRAELNAAPDLHSLKRAGGPSATPGAGQGGAKASPGEPRAAAPGQAQQEGAISDDKFNVLAAEVAEAAFADDRLKLLRDAAFANAFTAAQVARLLTVFPFPADRLRAVHVLWPRVVDRANSALLYESFSFQSEKDELRAILGE